MPPMTYEARDAFVAKVNPPPYEKAYLEVNRWLVRKQWSAQRLADAVGLARVTVNHWLQGNWLHLHSNSPIGITSARIWQYVVKHPIAPPQKPSERLLETRSALELRRRFHAGLRRRALVICYGPPSAEKTFVLRNLLAEHRADRREDAFLITCTPNMGEMAALREMCAALGTSLRSNQKQPLFHSLREAIGERERRPLFVFDEAQHLRYDAFECVRILRDVTGNDLADAPVERFGFGVIFAGSHDLLQRFIAPRNKPKMTQYNQRTTDICQLKGMDQDEVLTLAAKELGNGKPARLSDTLRATILKACHERDAYATDENGKPTPGEYFSPRRLARWIETAREKLAARRGER